MKCATCFREQAQALEERGVDFFLLETFSDIEELLAAIDAIRSFSQLPIVAQMTFSEDGTAYGGVRPADAAARAREEKCSSDRHELHAWSAIAASDY